MIPSTPLQERQPQDRPFVPGNMARKVRRVHFLGIGGIGMSGIAEVLLNLGFQVTGSDIKQSAVTERLAKLGCLINHQHRPANVAGADVVVISSAICADNLELAEARRMKIPVIPRAEMLGELMRMKFAIAVSGSHGKTTTTSMIAVLLHHAGLDPTVVIGGRLNIFGSNARLGLGNYLVAEADESDGSFLRLFPSLAIVTNIDAEHLNYFQTLDNLRQAFTDFINRTPFYGSAILCSDDPGVREILPRVERRFTTYGLSSNADVQADNIQPAGEGSSFDVHIGGHSLGDFRLQVPGRYNVQNALAVVATALELDLPVPIIREALELFAGVDRRFQTRGIAAGVRVVDDYGHHPTEIRATLEAARAITSGRVIAVFQPHRYSRVQALWDDFASAFTDADILVCTAIYPAGEAPLPGVSGEVLVEAIRASGHAAVAYAEDFETATSLVCQHASAGDIVITFGAGNINQVGEQILQRLEKGESS